jgi:hypothetical protein
LKIMKSFGGVSFHVYSKSTEATSATNCWLNAITF